MAIDKEGQLKRIDYGDRVFFESVTGIAGTIYPIGTAAMPSSVIADVLTLCAALNITRIDVHGILQLGAAMEHYTFFGHCHESITDVLDLNNQDVDDSRFDNCLITGAQGGTGFATYVACILYNMTGFRGMAKDCSLYTPLAVSVGVSDLDHCTSLHGTLTVTVGAPGRLSFKKFSGGMILTAQTGGVALVRGISGYLEVDLMTGGTLDIYADAADIQINADCIGTGVINIYGNARVIDNHGAGTTVNDLTVTHSFQEQADTAVNVNAILASETDIFDLNVADTRYIVRNLRLKCANPGADTVTVRLRELVNDVSTIVATFDITAANFATYFTLMDMFGVPYLDGDDLQVTVQASAAGPYVVTGQFSHATAT